jgi:hypothetical protein
LLKVQQVVQGLLGVQVLQVLVRLRLEQQQVQRQQFPLLWLWPQQQ